MPGGSKERDPSIEGVGWGAMGLVGSNIKVLTMICDLCSFLILIWETHTTFTTTCFSLLDVAHWCWQEVDFGNKTVAAGELSRVLTRTRGAAMVRKGV